MSSVSYQVNDYKKGDRPHSNSNDQNGNVQNEEIRNFINTNCHQLAEDVRCSVRQIISIGARCIAEINGQFFFLVEIEIDIPGNEIEQVIIFRITPAQAEALMRAGVRRCIIVTTIPTPRPGVEVNLICVFVVGDFAFLVFDVENNNDELVLVRVPLCTVI